MTCPLLRRSIAVWWNTRPIIMTALMAAIGLMPAALSTGIGSETQRPLAIGVIGGLVSSTILTLLIFPIIFERGYRNLGHAIAAKPEPKKGNDFEDFEDFEN